MEKSIEEKIMDLDLSIVKQKLCLSEKYDGCNWSKKRADEVEKQYQAFFIVMYRYQEDIHIPTKDIDSFWHTHILFTKKYSEDCEYIFGKYIHHSPQIIIPHE